MTTHFTRVVTAVFQRHTCVTHLRHTAVFQRHTYTINNVLTATIRLHPSVYIMHQ